MSVPDPTGHNNYLSHKSNQKCIHLFYWLNLNPSILGKNIIIFFTKYTNNILSVVPYYACFLQLAHADVSFDICRLLVADRVV